VLSPARFFDGTSGLRRLDLREEWQEKASLGAPIRDSFFLKAPADDGVFGAFDNGGELLAVLEKRGTYYRYAATFRRGGTV
jgi:hypothetical protein